VERGKIAEFAAAMQSENPAYAGPGAVAPPTFLISSALWAPEGAAVDHGFDRRRLLHGEQEFTFHGPPPRAGQTLKVSEQVVDRYEKPGKKGGMMRFAVVVTEVPRRGRHPRRGGPQDADRDRATRRCVLMTAQTPVQVGEKAEARDYGPLTTRMFVRYAGASGDFNPMHYDDTLARAAGYPSVFSQGMHSAAFARLVRGGLAWRGEHQAVQGALS